MIYDLIVDDHEKNWSGCLRVILMNWSIWSQSVAGLGRHNAETMADFGDDCACKRAWDTNTGLGARSLTRPSLPDLPFPLGMAGLCILVLEGVPWAPTYLSECLPHWSAQKKRNNSCRAPRVLNPTRRAIWPLFCVWWWGILVPVWSICNPLNWVRIITLNHYHNPSSSSNLIIVSIILIIMKG